MSNIDYLALEKLGEEDARIRDKKLLELNADADISMGYRDDHSNLNIFRSRLIDYNDVETYFKYPKLAKSKITKSLNGKRARSA